MTEPQTEPETETAGTVLAAAKTAAAEAEQELAAAHAHLADLTSRADSGDETVSFAAFRAAERRLVAAQEPVDTARSALATAQRDADLDTVRSFGAGRLTDLKTRVQEAWNVTREAHIKAVTSTRLAAKTTPHGRHAGQTDGDWHAQHTFDVNSGLADRDTATQRLNQAGSDIRAARASFKAYQQACGDYNGAVEQARNVLTDLGVSATDQRDVEGPAVFHRATRDLLNQTSYVFAGVATSTDDRFFLANPNQPIRGAELSGNLRAELESLIGGYNAAEVRFRWTYVEPEPAPPPAPPREPTPFDAAEGIPTRQRRPAADTIPGFVEVS